MRPTFELDPGLLALQSPRLGTERHTLPGISPPAADATPRPLLDGLADDFFAAGDDGCYAGGAALEPDESEGDEAPVTVIVRTPEMDARRAKLARFVAIAVGSLAALFAFGLARNVQSASASAAEQRPFAASTTAVQSAQLTAIGSRNADPSPPTRSRPAAAPSRASNVAGPPFAFPPVERVASRPPPSPARLATGSAPAPARPASARATLSPTPSVNAGTAASPRRTLPSVVDFAARAGDAPKSASGPPTAAFAPVH